MADFSMFVPNVHFEQIPIKNLVSNQEMYALSDFLIMFFVMVSEAVT